MIWQVVLAVLVAGHLVLSGIDYGVGLTGRPARLVRPYFLGNQVWFVAAVGVLLGAFPRADTVLLGDRYGAVSVILAGVVMAVTGLLAGFVSPGWDRLYRAGGLVAAAGWGAYLTVLATGESWAALAGAPAMVALMAAHGMSFADHRRLLLAGTSVLLALAGPAALLAAPDGALPTAEAGTLGVLAWVVLPLLPIAVVLQVLWWRLMANRVRPGTARSSG